MEGIETREDHVRGCGWRKEGGLYLITDGGGRVCYKLPVPLDICPTCGAGIKFSRGFTWIDSDKLLGDRGCAPPALDGGVSYCDECALALPRLGRAGLIWIGEQFYKTPLDFTREAARLGISRRIASVPRDFEVGKTWILLAHLKAISKPCEECGGSGRAHVRAPLMIGDGAAASVEAGTVTTIVPFEKCAECEGDGQTYTPGIFHLFQPARIEYVVTGDESQGEIDEIIKRGIVPVEIQKIDDPPLSSRQTSRGN